MFQASTSIMAANIILNKSSQRAKANQKWLHNTTREGRKRANNNASDFSLLELFISLLHAKYIPPHPKVPGNFTQFWYQNQDLAMYERSGARTWRRGQKTKKASALQVYGQRTLVQYKKKTTNTSFQKEAAAHSNPGFTETLCPLSTGFQIPQVWEKDVLSLQSIAFHGLLPCTQLPFLLLSHRATSQSSQSPQLQLNGL